MSIVHLKTRKQRIALNKKANEVKKILWKVLYLFVFRLSGTDVSHLCVSLTGGRAHD